MGMGQAVHVPGGCPDRWIAPVKETGVCHVVFEDGSGDRRKRLNGDKEVVSGRSPGGAVLREATGRDYGVEVGVILELSAPGVQDTGATREVGADTARIRGEAFAGRRRRLEQGLIGHALMRAEKGTEGRRDGKGEEEVRTWKVLLKLGLKPERGFVVLTLGAVSVAAGMVDTVWFAPALALIQAVSIVSA